MWESCCWKYRNILRSRSTLLHYLTLTVSSKMCNVHRRSWEWVIVDQLRSSRCRGAPNVYLYRYSENQIMWSLWVTSDGFPKTTQCDLREAGWPAYRSVRDHRRRRTTSRSIDHQTKNLRSCVEWKLCPRSAHSLEARTNRLSRCSYTTRRFRSQLRHQLQRSTPEK